MAHQLLLPWETFATPILLFLSFSCFRVRYLGTGTGQADRQTDGRARQSTWPCLLGLPHNNNSTELPRISTFSSGHDISTKLLYNIIDEHRRSVILEVSPVTGCFCWLAV